MKHLSSHAIYGVVDLYNRRSLRSKKKTKRTPYVDTTSASSVTRYQRPHRFSGFHESIYRSQRGVSFVKISSVTVFSLGSKLISTSTVNTSWPICVKFGMNDLHLMSYSGSKFCENLANWKPFFTSGRELISVRTFYIYYSIWVKLGVRGVHIIPMRIWVSWNAAQVGPCFYYGRNWNYVYVCTGKPCDILKVKNAVVKSLYYVTKYTI